MHAKLHAEIGGALLVGRIYLVWQLPVAVIDHRSDCLFRCEYIENTKIRVRSGKVIVDNKGKMADSLLSYTLSFRLPPSRKQYTLWHRTGPGSLIHLVYRIFATALMYICMSINLIPVASGSKSYIQYYRR